MNFEFETKLEISLQRLAFCALLSLTIIAPVNEKDPIDFKTIYSGNMIILSSGTDSKWKILLHTTVVE